MSDYESILAARIPEWKNQEVMELLIQNFRPGLAGDQERKISFWSTCVMTVCRQNQSLLFKGEEAPLVMRWRYDAQKPYPNNSDFPKWADVLEHMCEKCNDLQTVDRLESKVRELIEGNSDQSEGGSSSSGGGSFLWKATTFVVDKAVATPTKWAFGKVFGNAAEQARKQEQERMAAETERRTRWKNSQLVVTERLHALADELRTQSVDEYHSTHSLYTMSELRKIASKVFSSTSIGERELKWLLVSLVERKMASVAKVGNELCIKLSPHPMEDFEVKYLRTKQAESMLESRVHKLSEAAEKEKQKAAEAISQKKREIALMHLKRKKMFEQMFAKEEGSLHNITTMLHKIETAVSDREVSMAMMEGSKALDALLSDLEKQIDSGKLEEIQDVMLKADQISREVMGATTVVTQEEDDEELMAELEGLMEADKPKEKAPAEESEDADLALLQNQLSALKIQKGQISSPVQEVPQERRRVPVLAGESSTAPIRQPVMIQESPKDSNLTQEIGTFQPIAQPSLNLQEGETETTEQPVAHEELPVDDLNMSAEDFDE